MKKRRAWTEAELKILREEYPTNTDIDSLSVRLGRSWSTIRREASKNGIKKTIRSRAEIHRKAAQKRKITKVKTRNLQNVIAHEKKHNVRRLEDQVRKFRLPDLTGKILVKLDRKTSVYITPGENIEEIKKKLKIA